VNVQSQTAWLIPVARLELEVEEISCLSVRRTLLGCSQEILTLNTFDFVGGVDENFKHLKFSSETKCEGSLFTKNCCFTEVLLRIISKGMAKTKS